MKTSQAISIRALCGVLSLVCARSAQGEALPCRALTVEAEPTVLVLWPELPNRIRDSFAGRADVDACARITLSLSERKIRVQVTLPDGRSTSRSATQEEDAISGLEALLLVPAAEPTIAAQSAALPDIRASEAERQLPPSPKKARPGGPSAPRHGMGVERDGTTGTLRDRERRMGIELSLVTGARVGDGQSSLSLGALSLLELWGWLGGFEARSENYNVGLDTSQAAFQLAALLGHRFRFRELSLDVLAGPALTMQGESRVRVLTPEGEVVRTTSGTARRLLLATHLNFVAGSLLGGFVGLEGHVGAAGDAPDGPVGGPPAMPTWMLGVALGATVGTR